MEKIRPASEEETAYLIWRSPTSPSETPPERESKFKEPWEKEILPILLNGEVARIVLEEDEYYSAPLGLRNFVHKNTQYRIQTKAVFEPGETDREVLYIRFLEEY